MESQKIISRFDQVMTFSFYGLIYFLPVSTAFVEIFSTMILSAYFFKRGLCFYFNLQAQRSNEVLVSRIHETWQTFLRSFKPVFSYLNWPIGMYILANLCSVFASHDPILSLKGFIGKVVEATFLYFSFLECMKTKKQIVTFLVIYLISAGLIVINGLTQFFSGREFIHGKGLIDGRIISSFKHPNDFAGYLVVIILVILTMILLWGLYFRSSRTSMTAAPTAAVFPLSVQLAIGAILMGAIACLGFTCSRGAWFGFMMALSFVGLARRKILLLTVLIGALFFAIFIPLMIHTRNVSFVSDDVVRETGNDQQEYNEHQRELKTKKMSYTMMHMRNILRRFNGMGRNNFWKEAEGMIRDFPILGVGLNTYTEVAPHYKVTWGGYPHNCYLQMAAETGLVGLFCFIWIIARLYWNSLRNLTLIKDFYLNAISLGFLAGLFGYLCHSFFDTNFYSVQLGNFMWLAMAVIVTCQMLGLSSTHEQCKQPPQRSI